MNDDDIIETVEGHKFKYTGSFIYYICIRCGAKAEKQFVNLGAGKVPVHLTVYKEDEGMSCDDIKMRDMLK